MSDKDGRQLRKMQDQIALYDSQGVSLKGFVDAMEFLLSHIEGAPEDWRREMLSKLGVLEDTYAIALDKAGGVFSRMDLDRISSAIGRIVALVEAQLHRSSP